MFTQTRAFSGFSVDDIEKAADFYGSTLGLRVERGGMGTLRLKISGDTVILVYPKGADHRPASFTILNFPVEDIDDAVDALTERGVVFEQYDGQLQTDSKGIFRGGGPLIAWFKDPAGNVLSVIEEG